MKAMVLRKAGESLRLEELPIPKPKEGEVLIKVSVCGDSFGIRQRGYKT